MLLTGFIYHLYKLRRKKRKRVTIINTRCSITPTPTPTPTPPPPPTPPRSTHILIGTALINKIFQPLQVQEKCGCNVFHTWILTKNTKLVEIIQPQSIILAKKYNVSCIIIEHSHERNYKR